MKFFIAEFSFLVSPIPSSKREVKKETSNARALRKTTQQSFELNIIGLRYEEAMREVDKFIDNALVNN